ncbi:MAG: glycosyltransferase family 2 protein [Rubrivivax sp.]
MNSSSTKVSVIIASTGRPDSLAHLLEHLARQTVQPDEVILSVVQASDAPSLGTNPFPVLCQTGPKGLPAQRNTGLALCNPHSDLIVFFDDDYIPSRFCLERMVAFFALHPDVVGATGALIADGINSAGIAAAEAVRLVAEYDSQPAPVPSVVRELRGLYGCNMAFRHGAIGTTRFDERLKLYGWQEDIDFSNQVSRRGRLVKTLAFAGVHQGVKSARTSGVRLGYSQVINPVYLARKGTMSMSYARRLILKNVAANHLKALRPEPWVDRIGRVRGNWIGFMDVIKGRVTPERIESL